MRRLGQISVEYLLLLVVLILAFLYLMRPNSAMQQSVANVINQQGEDIKTMANKIFN